MHKSRMSLRYIIRGYCFSDTNIFNLELCVIENMYMYENKDFGSTQIVFA